MPAALISIITPAYHAEATLGRAVQSVLAQDYPHWEMCIAADDKQDYERILGNAGLCDARFRFFSTGGTRCGPARARNVALEGAKGAFAANLDADDELAPGYFSALLPAAQKYGAALAGVELVNDIPGTDAPADLYNNHTRDTVLPQEVFRICRHGSNMIFYDRARVRHRYVEDLPCAEDFVFLYQAYDQLEEIGFHAVPHYRRHKRLDSLTTSATVAEDFIRASEMILEKMASGALIFSNPDARQAIEAQIRIVLEAERAFLAARAENPRADFSLILKKKMNEGGYF